MITPGVVLVGHLLLASLPNGVDVQNAYDLAGRLTKLRNARQPSNVALSFYQYTYDQMTNRVAIRNEAGETAYVYDKLYRLTSADAPAYYDFTYSYAPSGNRLTETKQNSAVRSFTYLPGNRLSQVTQAPNQTTYQWDGAGNVKSKNAPGGLTTYTFDGANRMTRVQAPSLDLTFGYDANGQRVKEREGTRETWWVYDGLSPVMELNAARVPTTLLVPGISKTRLDLNEPFTEYFLHDGLGSVVQLTDSRGNLTQEYQYEPFGSLQDAERGMRDPFNRYRFVGLAHDDRLGLTYMNARWYDPGVGRFVSRDPVEGQTARPQSLNQYLYVENNPVNRTDLPGLFLLGPFDDLMFGGGAGGGPSGGGPGGGGRGRSPGRGGQRARETGQEEAARSHGEGGEPSAKPKPGNEGDQGKRATQPASAQDRPVIPPTSNEAAQAANRRRFEEKLPEGHGPITEQSLPGGGKAFQSEVPASDPHSRTSRAVYEKQVNAVGQTQSYTITKYRPDGSIDHISVKEVGTRNERKFFPEP